MQNAPFAIPHDVLPADCLILRRCRSIPIGTADVARFGTVLARSSHVEQATRTRIQSDTTRGKVASRSPCFISEHPRTRVHPEETETIPYRGHRVVPPSVAGLSEGLLPEIPSHAVGVIYMPQKISGIDADSKRPLAMALAKGARDLSATDL